MAITIKTVPKDYLIIENDMKPENVKSFVHKINATLSRVVALGNFNYTVVFDADQVLVDESYLVLADEDFNVLVSA